MGIICPKLRHIVLHADHFCGALNSYKNYSINFKYNPVLAHHYGKTSRTAATHRAPIHIPAR